MLSLIEFANERRWKTIYADPPWRFDIKNSSNSPEHPRHNHYSTMDAKDIMALPVSSILEENALLFLWVPNSLLVTGLEVLNAWGFSYKQTLVWIKTDKMGRPSRKGVAYYFQPMTELLLFGVHGKNARGLMSSTTQSNIVLSPRPQAGMHSRKPVEMRRIIEAASSNPRLELFARGTLPNWDAWGDQADSYAGEASEASGAIRSNLLW